jgi:hypothetical protein
MIPSKCKCNWLPSLAYITDPMWGHTIGWYVVCENCTRKGDIKLTRDEAIESWNNKKENYLC